jgi:hypothetical protein
MNRLPLFVEIGCGAGSLVGIVRAGKLQRHGHEAAILYPDRIHGRLARLRGGILVVCHSLRRSFHRVHESSHAAAHRWNSQWHVRSGRMVGGLAPDSSKSPRRLEVYRILEHSVNSSGHGCDGFCSKAGAQDCRSNYWIQNHVSTVVVRVFLLNCVSNCELACKRGPTANFPRISSLRHFPLWPLRVRP